MELNGVTVALNDFVCPSTNARLLGVRVSPVAGTVYLVTSTSKDLDTLPILTVIVERPRFKAVTLKPFHSRSPAVMDSFVTTPTLEPEEVTATSAAGRISFLILSSKSA